MWIPGVDNSVYQGRIEAAWFRAVRAAGYRVYVNGAWHGYAVNPHVYVNIKQALDAGLIPATYVALSPAYSGSAQVVEAYRILADIWPLLSFVAIDIELNLGDQTQAEALTAEALQQVRVLGQRPVIYTARWAWLAYLNNSCRFADEWLWNAYYDYVDDINYPQYPYGCWTQERLMGEQYTGTSDLFGVGVDFNMFLAEFVEDAMGMTSAELARLERLERLVGGYGIYHPDDPQGAEYPTKRLVSENALAYMDSRNVSLYLAQQRNAQGHNELAARLRELDALIDKLADKVEALTPVETEKVALLAANLFYDRLLAALERK